MVAFFVFHHCCLFVCLFVFSSTEGWGKVQVAVGDKNNTFLSFRYDDRIQVKQVAPKGPSGVFYATPTEIPKTQQFGVSLTWCVFSIISIH